MNKKILIPLFAFTIGVSPISKSFVVNAEEDKCISNTDIMLITAQHVKTNYGYNVYPVDIIPLYDTNDQVIAYNVNLNNGSYLIINSNKNNPSIIEFGEQQYVFQSVNKQYYISPLIVEESTNVTNNTRITNKIENNETFYSFLKSDNVNKKQYYDDLKSKIYSNSTLNLSSNSGNTREIIQSDYEFFLFSGELDSVGYEETYIYNARNLVTAWKNMNTFQNLSGVENHCAATSAYNLIYYYKYFNNDTLPNTTSEIHQLFLDIYEYIGEGPVTPLSFRNKLKDYLEEETNYNYTIEQLSETWSNYKTEINNNCMVNLCYMASLTSAHMVNGVGYREYVFDNYCIIYNNWDVAAYRYVLFDISELYRISKVDIYI